MEHPTTVVPGRMTARLDKPVVLFLIGTRFNRSAHVRQMAWFARTMPAMLAELEKKPEAGLLWYRTYISWPNIMVQQYWESFDKLMAYSADKGSEHRPAWARYMKELANDGSGRHLARDLSDRTGQVRMRLRQHAALRLGAASALVKAEGRLAAAKDRFAA
ncbi:MAG: DUF4188 domain-containing protein [Rhizomicrobium sp.]